VTSRGRNFLIFVLHSGRHDVGQGNVNTLSPFSLISLSFLLLNNVTNLSSVTL